MCRPVTDNHMPWKDIQRAHMLNNLLRMSGFMDFQLCANSSTTRVAAPHGLDSWEWRFTWRTAVSRANTVRYMSDAQVITLCKYVPLYAVSLGLAFCTVIREPCRRLQSVNIAAQLQKTYTWRTVGWDRDENMREKTCCAAVQQPYTGKNKWETASARCDLQ